MSNQDLNHTKVSEPSEHDWAEAIAIRIVDEWDGKESFSGDAELIKNLLIKTLTYNPDVLGAMIGTGIIEEDYFLPL